MRKDKQTKTKKVGRRLANIRRVAHACKISETRILWALNGMRDLSKRDKRKLKTRCPGDVPQYLKKLAFGV